MGVMKRSEMQTEVLARLNRSDTSDGDDVDVFLYRAMLDLATYRRFYETQTTATVTQSAAASTASAPSDFLNPIRMEWSDGSSLYHVSFKDLIYVRDQFSVGSTGRPDFVARFGDTFYFDRTADQEYAWTLYYKYRPPDFANDDDTSELNGEWDEALILWACAALAQKLRQFDVANGYKKMYYSYVKGRLGDIEEMEDSFNESFAGDIDDDPFTF